MAIWVISSAFVGYDIILHITPDDIPTVQTKTRRERVVKVKEIENNIGIIILIDTMASYI